MKYYKNQDFDGNIVAISTGRGSIEITKEEYDMLLTEIREKATLVNQLYDAQITIEDVPLEWRDEIQSRVDKMLTLEETSGE